MRTHGGQGVILGALLLILPATQAAVELMNYLVTSVLTPRGFLSSISESRAAGLRHHGRNSHAAH